MKVYELMDKLSTMPAGAKVQLSLCMTLNEFSNSTLLDGDDEPLYNITKEVDSAELASDMSVRIYC